MKTIKSILCFLLFLLLISCNEQNQLISPVNIKNDTVKSTVDTTKSTIDTTKHNYYIVKYWFTFIPYQNSSGAIGTFTLDNQNNITSDSIQKYINNTQYYFWTDSFNISNTHYIRYTYRYKPVAFKLPESKTDTIIHTYVLHMDSEINSSLQIPGLSGKFTNSSTWLKVTKTSLDYIIKSLTLDTVLKCDTIKFTLKVRYNRTETID